MEIRSSDMKNCSFKEFNNTKLFDVTNVVTNEYKSTDTGDRTIPA